MVAMIGEEVIEGAREGEQAEESEEMGDDDDVVEEEEFAFLCRCRPRGRR